MKGLFERGKIGFLPGIDYPDPDLSHFHSRHFWETGLITERSAPGWLGRWLDRAGNRDNPLQGISMGYGLSPVLRSGARAGGGGGLAGRCRVLDPRRVGRAVRRGDEDVREAGPRTGGQPRRCKASRDAVRLAKSVADRLAPVRRARRPRPARLLDPLSRRERLRAAAALPRGDDLEAAGHPRGARGGRRRLRHARQPEVARRAAGRRERVPGRLPGRPRGARRVRTGRSPSSGPSSAAGPSRTARAPTTAPAGWPGCRATAHGSGVHSEYPSLHQLDSHDNLKVTIDFRRVYASLLEQHLGADAASVIPNAAPARAAFPLVR